MCKGKRLLQKHVPADYWKGREVERIFISGAAGLVGQNLIISLLESSKYTIVAADKHPINTKILSDLHPEIEVIDTDISTSGPWEDAAAACDLAVSLHAQIGGMDNTDFDRNNIVATTRLLSVLERGRCNYIVHISSSAVKSRACDFYSKSKKEQENIIFQSKIPHVVLRPTLMYGWFDRKHLGWLKEFMRKTPFFPIPGNGKYVRQPLYVRDFLAIIERCLKRKITGSYDISGLENIDYVDLIIALRTAANLRTPIVKIPYALFWVLLKMYESIDRNPPFTTFQLKALMIPEIFDTDDWPRIFEIEPTSLGLGLEETFRHPIYSKISLGF